MKKSKKIILILILIFVIVILAICGNILRKYFILSKYISKENENYNSVNIYTKVSSGDNNLVISETYLKDNKFVEKSGNNTISFMEDKDKSTTYILFPPEENNGAKLMKIVNDNIYMGPGTNIIIDANSSWNRFKQAFNSKVEIEKFNGIKCYKVTVIDGVILWIDSETYNCIKVQNGSLSYVYEIKTNVVTDDDVTISLDGYTEI